jgi:hypothetical protein
LKRSQCGDDPSGHEIMPCLKYEDNLEEILGWIEDFILKEELE